MYIHDFLLMHASKHAQDEDKYGCRQSPDTIEQKANMFCTESGQLVIDFVCHYKTSNERESEVKTKFTGVQN